jgi:UPF0755 protein
MGTDGWQADPWDDVDVLRDDDLVEYGSTDSRRGVRSPNRVILIVTSIVLVLVLSAGGGSLWYLRQVNPPGAPLAAVTFTVNTGDTIDAVSKRLQAEGVITNARVFRWYVSRKGGIDFVPGYYQLMPRDHMGNVMAGLNTPPAQTFTKVTFPEGYTLAQIAARLEEKVPRILASTFLQQAAAAVVSSAYAPVGTTNLEGLLFPDTYQVSGDDSATRVIERMAGIMERVGRQVGLDKAKDKVGYTPYQVLVVASMIEREAKVSSDRAKIARVIYNRLRRKMPLQIDATLRYQQPDALSIAELAAIPSPYNTYLNKGLPPTPIASPGRASIEAALNPAPNPSSGDPICKGLKAGVKCEYIYYVIADSDGGHVFAATFAQHEANIAIAREKGLL